MTDDLSNQCCPDICLKYCIAKVFTAQMLCFPNVQVVAWCSGNELCRINEVALCRARLVLGWVTVYRQVNHLGMKAAS